MFSMCDSLPHTVNHGNNFFPVSVWQDSYSEGMPAIDPKAVLWNNIVALMRHSYGKENINQLHKDSGVSLATITRIKQQETSVGVEIVGKVADAFGLEAWQLMVPNLEPSHAPTLEGATEVWPFEAPLHKRLMSLSVKSRHMIEAWLQLRIRIRSRLINILPNPVDKRLPYAVNYVPCPSDREQQTESPDARGTPPPEAGVRLATKSKNSSAAGVVRSGLAIGPSHRRRRGESKTRTEGTAGPRKSNRK